MYTVQHHSYCGMADIPERFDTRQEARAYVAQVLAAIRSRGLYPVTVLDKGERWEVLEPEGCAMVPDACGVLTLSHVTHECPECGSRHETGDDAAVCCRDNTEDWERACEDAEA